MDYQATHPCFSRLLQLILVAETEASLMSPEAKQFVLDPMGTVVFLHST